MAKRTRKPPISPETRQDWFQRSTRLGESAAQIASKDNVDIRTVRKHIELARREVEINQAKAEVLRNAIQAHNHDLCTFAQKIDDQLKSDRHVLTHLKEDPLWVALHEHLPRSLIWKNLDKWEQLFGQISQLNRKLGELLEAQIEARLKSITLSQEVGLGYRMFRALNSHIEDAARAQPEILKNFNLNKIPESEDTRIVELIHNLLDEVAQWPEYTELISASDEFRKIRRLLHDQLLIILLRRVIPGRCRYCPV
jgi:hypothetical protein